MEEFFVGRERELLLYQNFLLGRAGAWLLVISGLGGIGKSALLERFKAQTPASTAVVSLDLSAEPALSTDALRFLQHLADSAHPFCDPLEYQNFRDTFEKGTKQLSLLIQNTQQIEATIHNDASRMAQRTYALSVVQEVRYQFLSLLTEVFCSLLDTLYQQQIVIMLDTCELLDETEGWEVRQWLMNRLLPLLHTRLPGRCFIVTAGRTVLRSEVIYEDDQLHLRLSLLDESAVHRYLEHVGVLNPEARRHLYQLTHGHALSVSIIGALWQQLAQPSFDEMESASLEAAFDEHALISFINERILQQLKSPYKELTQYGALLRTFNLPLLRAVFPEWLPEAEEAHDIFEVLVHFPYVESRGSGHYAFHALVREVLARNIHRHDPAAWQQYHKRVLDYLSSLAQSTLDLAQLRTPAWYYHAIAYTETSGMQAWQQAMQKVRTHGSRREIGALLQVAQDRTLTLTPLSLAMLAYEQGRFDDDMAQSEQALANYHAALTSFRQAGNHPYDEAAVLQAIGDAQRSLAQLQEALDSYCEALTLFERCGALSGQATTLRAIGDVQWLRKNWQAALASYAQALPLFRRLGDLEGEIKVQQALGDAQRFLGDTGTALESYRKALTLLRASSGRQAKEREAQLLRAIGDVQRQKRDIQAATESYQKALVLFRGNTAEEELVREAMHGVPTIDFSSDPEIVRVVAEGERLAYGSQFNRTFATEISRVEALPHQISAVYQHMLQEDRLRFLLADDAGAGKTIMAGLYIREMLTRRRISRVLIIPPAGLVGNWLHEMRTLFNLPFRIIGRADAQRSNPFHARPASDLLIVSLDTLYRQPMFSRLQGPEVEPYDLVIFDEAHKLAAYQGTNPIASTRKTNRYRLAEALAGALDTQDTNGRWALGWHCRHLLLLTATPHMGKTYPYYSLWRLLEPQVLATFGTFEHYPAQEHQRHFIRRTKEELVYFDGTRIYPLRTSDTLGYKLNDGEQYLYDETTNYLSTHYNRAVTLNRTALRLALGIFQRRLASSTYALLCSLERQRAKIAALIQELETKALDVAAFQRMQQELDQKVEDIFETKTGDEEEAEAGREENEQAEERALEAVTVQADALPSLRKELTELERLLHIARQVYDAEDESKFAQLRAVLARKDYAHEKLLIFTEYRDTLDFLVRRLEGLGFTGQVVCIHGGMDYREREKQIALFRKPEREGGAICMIATDAAGEGINLQFCRIMVNYDIPWNPARLEQRMGRIHRFGQKHNVTIINLVANKTREGEVIEALLKKLESIRKDLASDKIFDVIGRLFENVSLSSYMERVLRGENSTTLAQRLSETVTIDRLRRLEAEQRDLYGSDERVGDKLAELSQLIQQNHYQRFLPGYVRRFVEKAAPLARLRIQNEGKSHFSLAPLKDGELDWLLPAREFPPTQPPPIFTLDAHGRDATANGAFFLHPGESIFERLREQICSQFALYAKKGAIFVDPATKRPYFFHLASISLSRKPDEQFPALRQRERLGTYLIALRQEETGTIQKCTPELLLALYNSNYLHPTQHIQEWTQKANSACAQAEAFLYEHEGMRMVHEQRASLLKQQPIYRELLEQGFSFQVAELATRYRETAKRVRDGAERLRGTLTTIRALQQEVDQRARDTLAALAREPELVDLDEITFLAHVLVLPADNAEEAQDTTRALQEARKYEEVQRSAVVHDVTMLESTDKRGLPERPGFDLLSHKPGREGFYAPPGEGFYAPPEERAILVKGFADSGDVVLSENELAQSCNLGERYWLYVVFDCAKPYPQLYRIRNPFSKVFHEDYSEKRRIIITERQIFDLAER